MDDGFASLSDQLAHLDGLAVPWYVAGGWAIYCFVGRVTRDHQDVDLAISRDDQGAVHDHFPDREWSMIVPHPEGLANQGTIEPWDGEPLALPVHQILADDADGNRIEFLLNEIDDRVWRSRRHPGVTMPVAAMTLTSKEGVPYLAPEIVLLFKAKHMREWDEADFDTALPELDLGRRHWLYHALEGQEPGHPWMEPLGVT
jgi:hypothetical protein